MKGAATGKKSKRQQQHGQSQSRSASSSSVQYEQQKLIAFGRSYHFAIPETTPQVIPKSSKINECKDGESNDETHDKNKENKTAMTCATEDDDGLTVPIGQWENDTPPWIAKNSSGSASKTLLSSSSSSSLDSASSNIKQISCSFQSTLFLTNSGRIYQQGLLHGYCMPVPTRIDIPLPLKCIQITAGRHFCLALLESGVAVVSWGAGHFGQLGIGSNYGNNSNSPGSTSDPITFTSTPCIIERLLPHSNDSPVISIAAGDWHALALTQSGRVWAWGCNRNLQCGRKVKNGSSNSSPSSNPGAASNAASSPAPTITVPLPVPLGPSSSTQSSGTNPGTPNKSRSAVTSFHVTHIAAGRSHSMVIAKETSTITVLISASSADTTSSSSSTSPLNNSPTVAKKAITKNVVYCWGNSHHGQCGNIVTRRSVPGVLPQPVESLRDVDIRQISAAGNHSMALTAQGRILSWGSHLDGQLGIGVVATTEGLYNEFMESQDDVTSTSSNPIPNIPSTSAIQCKPRLVSDLDFVAIAAGQEWTKQQQLSASSNQSSENATATAALLSSIPRIQSVHAGPTYSAAITSLGQLYVWGSNDAGQLGIPIPSRKSLPFLHEDNNALRVVMKEEDNLAQSELVRMEQTSSPSSASTDGCKPTSTTTSNLLQRPVHAQTFDSRHNILLPLRVDAVNNIHVQQLACGPNHMWCMGRARTQADIEELSKVQEHSKTLYEVQLEHQQSPSAVPKRSTVKPLAPTNSYEETQRIAASNNSLASQAKAPVIKHDDQDETSASENNLDGNNKNSHYQLPSWAINNNSSIVDDSADEKMPIDTKRHVTSTSPPSAITMNTVVSDTGLRSVASASTVASGIAAATTYTTTDAEEITETEGNDYDYDEEDDTTSRWSQSMTSLASTSYHQGSAKQSQQLPSTTQQSRSSKPTVASNEQRRLRQQDDEPLQRIRQQVNEHYGSQNVNRPKHRGRLLMKEISKRFLRRKKQSADVTAVDVEQSEGGDFSSSGYPLHNTENGDQDDDSNNVNDGTNSTPTLPSTTVPSAGQKASPNGASSLSPLTPSKKKTSVRSSVFGGLRKK